MISLRFSQIWSLSDDFRLCFASSKLAECRSYFVGLDNIGTEVFLLFQTSQLENQVDQGLGMRLNGRLVPFMITRFWMQRTLILPIYVLLACSSYLNMLLVFLVWYFFNLLVCCWIWNLYNIIILSHLSVHNPDSLMLKVLKTFQYIWNGFLYGMDFCKRLCNPCP